MTDDIVMRLRKWARRIESWQFESDTTSELREAADEIERLRAEVAYLKQGWYPTPATVQQYRVFATDEAVRGD